MSDNRNKNSQKRTSGSQNKAKRNKHLIKSEVKNYNLILILAVICIVPMIVRLKIYEHNMDQFQWFSSSAYHFDLFLYYKQWILIVIAALMACVLIYKAVNNRREIRLQLIFIPLAIYGTLALLSAIFSKYSTFSFSGGFEQFESVFALIGYCIIAYYSFLFVRDEKDFKTIIKYMIVAALIMSVLGVLQFMGRDFFTSKAAVNFIIPKKYRNGADLTLNFEQGRVYLTLFNPNYVGVFVALFAPLILSIAFFQRNIVLMILSFVSVVGLVICLVGSKSLSGYMGLAVAIFCIIVFLWRILLKRFYITVPIVLFILLGLVTLNNYTDNLFMNKLMYSIKNAKVEYSLTDMETKDDYVTLTYKGNELQVRYLPQDDQTSPFLLLDGNNQGIPGIYDPGARLYAISDERFTGIALGMDSELEGVFFIQVDGRQYRFTNLTVDGTYYYMNKYNKIDKIVNAPAAVFDGYEALASGRGYIWSRTIPLIKKYIFLGSGPDTYTMAFPQQDYVNLAQSGYGDQILTKPHSLYLQIAVQTGLLSLIAFLTFYGMYFVQSIKLYLRGRFNTIYAKVGVAIFISTIAYMFTGLTNDSSITTAPIFWALIGIGISANKLAKPHILKERESLKAMKLEQKVSKAQKLSPFYLPCYFMNNKSITITNKDEAG